MKPRQATPERTERGDGPMFLLVSVAALICAVGLVVDGGGRMYAADDARFTAEQAARAGGQEIDNPSLRMTSVSVLSRSRAEAAAEASLSAAGAHGTVSVGNDGTVTVTVDDSYQPKFLVFIGTLSLKETASAHPQMG